MAQGDRNQQQQQRTENGPRGQTGERRQESERGQGGALAQPRRSGGLSRGGGGGLGAFGASSPFSFMRRFTEDMDRLFGDFGLGGDLLPWGGSSLEERGALSGRGWVPQLEVFQDGDSLVVRADLPGVKKEDVSIEIEDDVLTISGERCEESRDEREGFFRSERSYGRFERAIRLPEGTDPETCDARYENGVLELRIKTPEEAQRRARRIPIRGEGETASEKPMAAGAKPREKGQAS